MTKMTHPSWVDIDLDQFTHNIAAIRERAGSARVCIPVKANAYGHGLIPMGRCAEAAGADTLAVAHLQEGLALREGGVTLPILILGAIDERQIDTLIANDLEFSLSSPHKAHLVAARCPNRPCRVHLEVDTGMQRTGMRPETAKALYAALLDSPYIDVVGIYSHFASSDRPNDPITLHQIAAFTHLLEDPLFQGRPLIRHLCNSGGLLHYPEAHLDMVRPGILTYDNVLSLKSRIVFHKLVEKGTGISYGHTYQTRKQTRIATIPIGYGDGYLRRLSNKGSVLIHGKRFPIVGTICMDQLMVDIGDQSVHIGDEVTLIGKQGEEEITIEEIARLSGTITYEILTLLSSRLPRVYSSRSKSAFA